MTPSTYDLLMLHANALYTYDANERILRVNEPDGPGSPAPAFFLGRTAAGSIGRYRSDVPSDLIAELERLRRSEPADDSPSKLPVHHEQYVELIYAALGVSTVSAGPVYCVRTNRSSPTPPQGAAVAELEPDEAGFLHPWLHDWVDYLACARPFLVTVTDDAAVSVCCSVRITGDAHEAGVETAPGFRRHGYAVAAVAAWAEAVRAMNRAPLYSTSWENTASQGLARKLDMIPVGADFSVG